MLVANSCSLSWLLSWWNLSLERELSLGVMEVSTGVLMLLFDVLKLFMSFLKLLGVLGLISGVRELFSGVRELFSDISGPPLQCLVGAWIFWQARDAVDSLPPLLLLLLLAVLCSLFILGAIPSLLESSSLHSLPVLANPLAIESEDLAVFCDLSPTILTMQSLGSLFRNSKTATSPMLTLSGRCCGRGWYG